MNVQAMPISSPEKSLKNDSHAKVRRINTATFLSDAWPLPCCICPLQNWAVLAANSAFFSLFDNQSQHWDRDCLANWLAGGVLEMPGSISDFQDVLWVKKKNGVKWLLYWRSLPDNQSRAVSLIPFPDSDLKIIDTARELDRILESIHDGIWVIDGDGITRRVNRAMERIAGINAKEVIGKHVSEPLREGKFKTCVTLRALEEKRTVTLFDDYSNGKRCLNTSTPIYNEAGEVWRVIAAIRDLSEIDTLKNKLNSLEMEALAHRRQAQRMDKEDGGMLLGEGPEITHALQEISRASQCDAITLILGETGTGKSLAARLIHQQGPRSGKPFVTVNCGAIPPTLIESELFGYESGAFTGAMKHGKPGLFELASGGTLLLDEIGELPLEMQAKLLHILDGQPLYRLGSSRPIQLKTRIIAATNQPLEELAANGAFRQDLYYRLSVLCISLPPLRERKSDIPKLACYFLERACAQKKFSADALRLLSAYSWPGNVRELRNVAQSLAILCDNPLIEKSDLPKQFTQDSQGAEISHQGSLTQAVAELEKSMLARALAEGGSTYKAAQILGISQSQVARKAKKYGLPPGFYPQSLPNRKCSLNKE